MIDDSLTLHRFFLITLKHRKDGNATLKNIFIFKVNAARKSKVDDNTARMQSIKQLGV